jgi:hypothetical protein
MEWPVDACAILYSRGEMPSLTFYPLGNADSCRLSLANGDQVLFDFGAVRNSNDPNDKRCDLHEELRKAMKAAKRDRFAAAAFTHLDDDHVKGSQDFFFLEHAKCYQEGERYKIDELWIPAAAIIEEGCVDDARIIRAEARYRLRNGERIRVFSRPEALKEWLAKEGISYDSRKHLFVDAGQLVPTFSLAAHGVEFFVHSPFASRLNETEVIDRNTDSIVVQTTFQVDSKLTRVILGSDVDYEALGQMVKITKFHGREERLEWDVFKLVHHCSYTGIGPDRGKEKTQPTEETKWLYEEKGLNKAVMISTSWPIPVNGSKEDECTQPPHCQAYAYHKEHTDTRSGRLKVTMEHPKQVAPEPLVIEIDGTKARIVESFIGGASVVTSRQAPRAGYGWTAG